MDSSNQAANIAFQISTLSCQNQYLNFLPQMNFTSQQQLLNPLCSLPHNCINYPPQHRMFSNFMSIPEKTMTSFYDQNQFLSFPQHTQLPQLSQLTFPNSHPHSQPFFSHLNCQNSFQQPAPFINHNVNMNPNFHSLFDAPPFSSFPFAKNDIPSSQLVPQPQTFFFEQQNKNMQTLQEKQQNLVNHIDEAVNTVTKPNSIISGAHYPFQFEQDPISQSTHSFVNPSPLAPKQNVQTKMAVEQNSDEDINDHQTKSPQLNQIQAKVEFQIAPENDKTQVTAKNSKQSENVYPSQTCSPKEVEQMMRGFWDKNEELIYSYIDQQLSGGDFSQNQHYKKALLHLDINIFAYARPYIRKQINETQNQNEGTTPIEPENSCEETNTKNSKKSKRRSSRFQNLTKLLMYRIIKILESDALKFLYFTKEMQYALRVVLKRLKELVRDKVRRSDFINHSHYRALFLKLTDKTIAELISKQNTVRDAENHKRIFQADLNNLSQLDRSYCNILKRMIFNLFQLFSPSNVKSDELSCKELLNNGYELNVDREEYLKLAKKGIFLMNNGQLVNCFDKTLLEYNICE